MCSKLRLRLAEVHARTHLHCLSFSVVVPAKTSRTTLFRSLASECTQCVGCLPTWYPPALTDLVLALDRQELFHQTCKPTRLKRIPREGKWCYLRVIRPT